MPDPLLEAVHFVYTIEKRQRLKLAVLKALSAKMDGFAHLCYRYTQIVFQRLRMAIPYEKLLTVSSP
jgi:hypothetical protein